MDLLQSGVRTLKRHSISNISDAIRNHIHRDSFSGLGRHLFFSNKTDHPLKNAAFASVSAAVVRLFQKKKLQENELSTLQESIRNLSKTEAGPLIYDYYKDNLIRKGMVIIREKIKQDTGILLLTNLGDQWNYFYGEILPVLYALLYTVETKTYTIREVALLEFRNTVLLKLPVKDALCCLSRSEPVYSTIQQMLLILHGVRECPCTDNYIELEKLISRVTCPLLGIKGLYMGGDEPEVKSNYKQLPKLKIPVIQISDNTNDSNDQITSTEEGFNKATTLLQQDGSGYIQSPLLEAISEQDRIHPRRNSIATA